MIIRKVNSIMSSDLFSYDPYLYDNDTVLIFPTMTTDWRFNGGKIYFEPEYSIGMNISNKRRYTFFRDYNNTMYFDINVMVKSPSSRFPIKVGYTDEEFTDYNSFESLLQGATLLDITSRFDDEEDHIITLFFTKNGDMKIQFDQEDDFVIEYDEQNPKYPFFTMEGSGESDNIILNLSVDTGSES